MHTLVLMGIQSSLPVLGIQSSLPVLYELMRRVLQILILKLLQVGLLSLLQAHEQHQKNNKRLFVHLLKHISRQININITGAPTIL